MILMSLLELQRELLGHREGASVFMVANAGQKPVAEAAFIAAGADMTKVEWIEEFVDAVWIRD